MKSLLIVLILSVMMISGCGNEDYRKADGKILCDPLTGSSFHVKGGVGDISYVTTIETTMCDNRYEEE